MPHFVRLVKEKHQPRRVVFIEHQQRQSTRTGESNGNSLTLMDLV